MLINSLAVSILNELFFAKTISARWKLMFFLFFVQYKNLHDLDWSWCHLAPAVLHALQCNTSRLENAALEIDKVSDQFLTRFLAKYITLIFNDWFLVKLLEDVLLTMTLLCNFDEKKYLQEPATLSFRVCKRATLAGSCAVLRIWREPEKLNPQNWR